MLKVECESCKAPYQVDERRVPAAGLKMRCPKCGHSFVVKNPAAPGAGAGPADSIAPKAPRVVPRTGGPIVQKASMPAGPLPGASSDDLDLPAVARADLPAAVNRGPSIQKRAPSPSIPSVLESDLPDLPAPRADLPAFAGAGARMTKPGVAPPAPAAARGKVDFELDLPAVGAPRPKGPQVRPKQESDLPAPASDLPAFKPAAPKPGAPKAPPAPPRRNTMDYGNRPLGSSDLPASMDIGLPVPVTAGLPAPVTAGLPSAKRGMGQPSAFGEIDLPTVQNELPSIANNLPTASGRDQHLPARVDDGRHLPSAVSDDRHLPSAMGGGGGIGLGSLPPAFGGSADDFGELELPRPPAPGAPRMTTPGMSAPPPVFAAPSFAPPAFASRSLNEPPPPEQSPFSSMPPPMAPQNPAAFDGGFGELELPNPPGGGSASSPPTSGGSHHRGPAVAGGMAFGELDLGGGGDDGGSGDPFGTEVSLGAGSVVANVPSGPPSDEFNITGSSTAPEPFSTGAGAAAHAPVHGGAEASLDSPATTGRRDRSAALPKKASKLPKILGGLLAAVIVGGASLYLTPYGPFGYYAVTDQMHAGDYARALGDAMNVAHTKLASDVFPEARAACDEVAAMRAASPRARALTAYAAVAEVEQELRFGRDNDRATKAKLWLTTEVMKDHADTRYVDVAQTLQAAIDGELDKARGMLDAASKKYSGDPIAQDIAFARGELELDAKDAAAAASAFTAALALAPGARAHFGLARAALFVGDLKTAKAEVDETLKASPKHGGAILMRAELAWAHAHDDDAAASALKDLGSVIEGDAKTTVSQQEIAEANAARGWIQLLRGRTAEARAGFEAAVKLDARNLSALIGQGEILYQDGRFTEALTRFDTAVQTDATNVNALVGDAKTKIALERLADAKTQLTAAKARYPKSMLVMRWLGSAEAALGNKKDAEKNFVAAIALVDPNDPDAMQPYAAFAAFLAGQGRAIEAAAKLEEARTKLPDSAELQRTLGDVAVAQSQYDAAIVHFKAALARDPQDLSTKFKLGQTERRMNKMTEASATFDEVAAIDKDFPGLSLERGLLYEQSGNVAKALEMFQGALEKAPNDADLQLRVGAALVVVGKPEEALALLKKVREQRPNSAEVYHYEGRANLLRGPLQEVPAMRSLKKAVELDPNRAEYHLYVGLAATQANPPQLGLAKTEIDRALAIDSLLADGYWQRAVIEQKEGAIEDGLKDARRALELKPTRFEAHATMAECYEQRNDSGAALAEWQKAIAGDDKNAYWRYKLGRLLADHGNLPGAAENLSFAVVEGSKIQPRPGWVNPAYFLAAEALRKTGKRAEAIEAYNHFLETANSNNPDRRDAIETLKTMGAPWQGN